GARVMPTTTVPGHIFREYDIRGLHATELSDPTAEAVGRAFATRIRAEGGTRVALGQDVRPSSERLARAAEPRMIAAGLAVERVGVVPTPALYYAVAARALDGGMQITGSHNPPEFNGFKMTKKKLPLYGPEILEMRRAIQAGELATGAGGSWSEKPVLDAYREMLRERCASPKGLQVVMDCGNGCAGTVLPQGFERTGPR